MEGWHPVTSAHTTLRFVPSFHRTTLERHLLEYRLTIRRCARKASKEEREAKRHCSIQFERIGEVGMEILRAHENRNGVGPADLASAPWGCVDGVKESSFWRMPATSAPDAKMPWCLTLLHLLGLHKHSLMLTRQRCAENPRTVTTAKFHFDLTSSQPLTADVATAESFLHGIAHDVC